jgi:tetratricopeptide (TPR) repeat protein
MQLPIVGYRLTCGASPGRGLEGAGTPAHRLGCRPSSRLSGFSGLSALAAAGIVAVLPWGTVNAAQTVIFNESAAHLCYLEALRGSTLVETEDCDAALEHQSLKREDFAATLSNRGLLLARSGDTVAALRDHDRAIESAPEIPSLYINRANTYSRAARLAEARADLDRAILMIESAESSTENAAGSAAGMPAGASAAPATPPASAGPSDTGPSAADAAVPVLDLRPVLAAAYYNRALIEQRERNLDRALADAVRARDLAPDTGNYAAYVADLELIRAARANPAAAGETAPAAAGETAPAAAGEADVNAEAPAGPATGPATAPATSPGKTEAP